MDSFAAIEEVDGKKAIAEFPPLQKGVVPDTYSGVGVLVRQVGSKLATPMRTDVARPVPCYQEIYEA